MTFLKEVFAKAAGILVLSYWYLRFEVEFVLLVPHTAAPNIKHLELLNLAGE